MNLKILSKFFFTNLNLYEIIEREREKVLFTVNLWIKVNEQLGLKKKWLPITHTIHTGCDKNTKWSDDDCGYLFSKWNINKGSYYCLDSVYLQGFVTVILQLVVGLAHVNREGSYQVSLMNPYIVVRCCRIFHSYGV